MLARFHLIVALLLESVDRNLRAYYMEITIYAMLGVAALIMALAPLRRVEASGLSMKDPPGYGAARALLKEPRRPQSVKSSIEIPQPKPEGRRYYESPKDQEIIERRTLLARCASYFIIARSIFQAVDEDIANAYQVKFRVMMRELVSIPLPKGYDKDTVQNNIFFSIYEEYTQYLQAAPEGAKPHDKNAGLYDQYDEICSAVVRPLLLKHGPTIR